MEEFEGSDSEESFEVEKVLEKHVDENQMVREEFFLFL